MANTFDSGGGGSADGTGDRDDKNDRTAREEKLADVVREDQQRSRDTTGGGSGANEGSVVDDSDDRPDSSGGGLTDAEQQNVQAGFEREIEGFGQGVETGDGRAAEFERGLVSTDGQLNQVEQRISSEFDDPSAYDVERIGAGRYRAEIVTGGGETVTREYGVADDPSEVRIDREGDSLVASFTNAGLEAAGVNPTNQEIRNQVAADTGYSPSELRVTRDGDNVSVSLTDQAADRQYNEYLDNVRLLAGGDPGRYREAAPNDAVSITGDSTPFDTRPTVTLSDLPAARQDEINQDLVQQYSRQTTTRRRRQELAEAEQFGDYTLFRIEGTSPEEFVRGVSDRIRGGSRDLSERLVPEDREFVVPTTSGVFVFGGDSQLASASRGSVQAGGDLLAAPFDAAVAAKELGEYGIEGVDRTLAGEGGEYIDETGAAAVDLGEAVYGQYQENPAEFTTRLAGTAVLAGGAIRGAQLAAGSRGGRAAAFAIQPGEELAYSAGGRLLGSAPDLRVRQFLGEERGQFDTSQRTRRRGREKTIEVEEGSELAKEIDEARREFVENAVFREGSGELEINTESIETGRTAQERRFDTDDTSTNAEDRLPAREEFESDAAYERELEAMRERIRGEERAADTEAQRADSLTRETVGAVAAAGLAAGQTTGATAFGRDTATDTTLSFGTLGGDTQTIGARGLTDLDTRVGTRELTDQTFDYALEREFDLTRDLELETEAEYTTDLVTDTSTEFTTETEQTTELGLEMSTERTRTRTDTDMRAEEDMAEIGLALGLERGGGDSLLGPGWFSETAQGFVEGGLRGVTSPSQEDLRELAAGYPGADLPTQEILSGEVDIEPVREFYNIDGDNPALTF